MIDKNTKELINELELAIKHLNQDNTDLAEFSLRGALKDLNTLNTATFNDWDTILLKCCPTTIDNQ